MTGLTSMSEYQLVVHYPLMTEDAVALIEAENKLTFIVDTKASKARIKKAVESLYQVKVSKVNVSITPKGVKKAFVTLDPLYDESKVGYYLTLVSSQLGMKKNDFLRQVVAYAYPRHDWEKDNFSIREEYRALVTDVLADLKKPDGAA